MAKEPFSAKLTTIWIGAFIFFCLNCFTKTYKYLIQKRFEKRNLVVGYLFQIFLLILFVWKIYF